MQKFVVLIVMVCTLVCVPVWGQASDGEELELRPLTVPSFSSTSRMCTRYFFRDATKGLVEGGGNHLTLSETVFFSAGLSKKMREKLLSSLKKRETIRITVSSDRGSPNEFSLVEVDGKNPPTIEKVSEVDLDGIRYIVRISPELKEQAEPCFEYEEEMM